MKCTRSHAWTTTLHLADRFNLTLYDAAFLELAQCHHLPLATLDPPIHRAAQSLNLAAPT